MRGAAQKREIAGDLQFGITRPRPLGQCRGSRNEDAVDEPARRSARSPGRARRGTARSAVPPRPRPGSNRESRRRSAGRLRPHHSSAMRSGPSARGRVRAPPPGKAERRLVRQQPDRLDRLRRRRTAEPGAAVLTASRPALPCTSESLFPRYARGGGSGWGLPPTGTKNEARSGMWLSRASMRPTASSPSRAAEAVEQRRDAALAPARRGESMTGRSGRSARAAAFRRRSSARIMSSTPRPGSTVSSRCRTGRRDGAGRGSAARCRGGYARPCRRPGGRRGRAAAPHPLARQTRRQLRGQPLDRADEDRPGRRSARQS